MVATEERNIRNELRMKLYTGRTRVVNGRGGAPIPESCADEKKPGLIEMWPKYLASERTASKLTLWLPDVAAMLEQRATPRYNAMVPRPLSDPEVVVIQAC